MSRTPLPHAPRRRVATIDRGSAAERVAAWEALSRPSGTIEIDPDLAPRFTADCRFHALGSAMAMRVACDSYRFRRDEGMAGRVVRDQVFVNFVERGRFAGRLAGRHTVVETGAVLVTRHGVPMNMRIEDATWFGLLVPMSRLVRHMDWRSALDAKVFAPGSASAVLLGHHLRSLMELPDDLSAAHAERIASESLRFLLPHLAAGRSAGKEAHGQEAGAEPTDEDDLRYAVRRFIADHLADPGLGAGMVCEAFALSRSRLYRLFGGGLVREGTEAAPGRDGASDTGDGVAAIIRRLRLQCAHRELADPSAPPHPIGKVGARWGMPDERSFRRAFFAQFGYPPSQVRKHMEATRAGDGFDAAPRVSTAEDASREIERWFDG